MYTMIDASTALTKQRTGFFSGEEQIVAYTANPYVGCQFGTSLCGSYCYAQKLPSWLFHRPADTAWGEAVYIKQNYGECLRRDLSRLRKKAFVFLGSATDPYQGVERRTGITRESLCLFAESSQIFRVVVQTRSVIARRDFDVLAEARNLTLSVTVEAIDAGTFSGLPHPRPSFESRLAMVKDAVAAGVSTQIVVSPVLQYSERFVDEIAETGVRVVVLDTLTSGDGRGGARSRSLPIIEYVSEEESGAYADSLASGLSHAGIDVRWGFDGFVRSGQ